jgi:deoxyribonuclease IV
MKKQAKIGVHISIAGGIDKAPARANEAGCETFQCFTRSPQGGPAPELTLEIVENFKSEMKAFGFETFYIHTPYYINFASQKNNVRHGSISVVRSELERGGLLGAKYVMTHMGSYAEQTLEEGIKEVITGIESVLNGYKGTTELLIEIAAGSGNIIGDKFEEIGEIVKHSAKHSGFGGVCFDTCHAFASGYDFRTRDGAKAMLKEFDEKIGLKWLKLSHINDSKFDLGMKKDRHEHIGDGFIGKEGITTILNTHEFTKIDWLLETEDDKREKDIEALKKIRA